MNESVSSVLGIYNLTLKGLVLLRLEFEMVIHVKLTAAICLVGKWAWLTTQLPNLSGGLSLSTGYHMCGNSQEVI